MYQTSGAQVIFVLNSGLEIFYVGLNSAASDSDALASPTGRVLTVQLFNPPVHAFLRGSCFGHAAVVICV